MSRKSNYSFSVLVVLVLALFISCAHKSGHTPRQVNSRDAQEVKGNPSQGLDEKSSRESNDKKIAEHTRVKMKKDSGVYLVPITVNGLDLDFIFDTGASSICISTAEAVVMLRQHKITEDDVLGKQRFQDATGGISEGTIVRLRTVNIGGIELHNIEATVVDNMQAPLLLGQTALAKFGKVTIDYENETIEFN